MLHRLSRAVLAFCLLSLPALAQAPETTPQVRLQYAQFDPAVSVPEVPVTLRGDAITKLWIVQFDGLPTDMARAAVTAAGGQIHGYLPDNSYVVRMARGNAATVQRLASVRWVGQYHPAYRLEPELVAEHLRGQDIPARRYNIVVVDKHNDKPALARKIAGMGGVIDDEQQGSILFTVTLTAPQLLKAARLDEVLWIDRWTPAETDMNNARIQGGGDYVEAQGGYTGTGLNAHIYEGIETTHPAYSGTVTNVRSGGASSGHGTNTAGIVFGDGTGNPTFRGMAPDVGKFYTTYNSVVGSRWQVVSDLVNIHDVSFTTASWGGGRTRSYTSISADTDDIIFDHDIVWTQSQSNASNQDSRPQAWAKNIFSIGGVAHYNNSNPLDDSWQGGGASTGPAADGRIKPTLCAYYDGIGTTATGGSYTTSFGGTSGATPIIAGHNGLALQMFTDGIFGNTLRNPGGNRHSNRPHFTTLKALQVVSAAQYSFTASSSDNRREHQGWGFPDLARMYDNRNKTFIVDETDILTHGLASRWNITVLAGEPELKICMTHAEPAANPGAAITRINDLSIRVTAPNGTVYWGNQGLEAGLYNTPGGSEDHINPIECVFVQNPAAGVWAVDVAATLVVQDSHVETPAVDADYGLVVSGGTGVAGPRPIFGSFATFGQGCPGSVQLPSYCTQLNPNGGSLTGTTSTLTYAYDVLSTGTTQVTGFDLFTSGSGTANAYLFSDVGGQPSAAPVATTTMTVGGAPGFYTATFATPVSVTGNYYIALQHTNASRSQLSSGASGGAYYRSAPLTGAWSRSGYVSRPSYRVYCTGGGGFAPPEIGNQDVATVNGSFDVTLSSAAPNATLLNVIGFSDQSFSGGSLPFTLPGAPGCDLLVRPDDWTLAQSSGAGMASTTLNVPNNPVLIGLEVFHQWLVADAVNNLGIVTSDGGKSVIGS